MYVCFNHLLPVGLNVDANAEIPAFVLDHELTVTTEAINREAR